jgi:hypothetical protein
MNAGDNNKVQSHYDLDPWPSLYAYKKKQKLKQKNVALFSDHFDSRHQSMHS